MKKKYLILLLSFFLNQNVFAITLSEALLQAYLNNPELNAERENIKVSKEDLNISRSEFLPTVTLSGSRSEENTDKLTDRTGASSSITDVNPKTQSIKIEQKLFQGFAGVAGLQKSKIGLDLADAKLLKVEQEILYKAIEAYSGVVFANKKLKINEINLSLLERQVETDQARLERGQVTLADLAQSESSLAGAQAKFIQAKNDIVTAKLEYEKIIGKWCGEKYQPGVGRKAVTRNMKFQGVICFYSDNTMKEFQRSESYVDSETEMDSGTNVQVNDGILTYVSANYGNQSYNISVSETSLTIDGKISISMSDSYSKCN